MTNSATRVADGLWTLEGDEVRMLGIPFATRMAVVSLPGGGLWVWSPVQPTDKRIEAVRALGEVKHLVAPNRFHHLFLGDWQQAFPGARLWAPPGLRARREDLTFDGDLEDEAPPAWRDTLTQVVFRGSKVITEVLFVHLPSQTLLVTDILQNHDPKGEAWGWRQLKGLNGIMAPRGGCPRDWKLTVRDRAAARVSRDRLLALEVRRVVFAHGLTIDDDVTGYLQTAFAWL